MIPGIAASNNAYLSPSAPSLWSPINMATVPPIYIDASGSAITESGGIVSAITNLGALGSNGDFSQSDSARRPSLLATGFNGMPCLSFDGTSDLLTCDTTSARDIHRGVGYAWIFSVYLKRGVDGSPTSRSVFTSPSGTTGSRASLLCGVSTAGNANKPNASYKRQDADSSGSHIIYNSALNTAAIVSLEIRFSAGAIRPYINGSIGVTGVTTSGATSNTAAASALAMGAFSSAGNFADIDIAAVVVGNTDLSADDRQKLEGWAAHKWSLTGSLPSGHPYKLAAPTV